EPAASAAQRANAGAAPGAMPDQAVGGMVWWPAGLTVAIVLAVLAWGWARHEQYVVHPTREYRDAVVAWQGELLAQPEAASPRELKRFLNISRYAVARLRSGAAPALPETRLVELSARWMLARGRPQSEVRQAMLQPTPDDAVAAAADVDAFLQIVGDLD